MSHPFGDLLTQYRARKHGLTQARLAMLTGYDAPLITKLCQGKKELSGQSGRERVVRVMAVLCDEGALTTLEEANALLKAAGMPPLYDGAADEAALMRKLPSSNPSVAQAAEDTTPNSNNLPTSLSHFVGRRCEMAEVCTLLASTRLLTFTGSGGCGKTRLAIEVATATVQTKQFRDGVWLIELASLNDPDFVADTAITALHLPSSSRPAIERLINYLHGKHLLLVLDNCEHLIAACAELAAALLHACPELHILTTSREALNIPGEVMWRVPSLATPDPADLPPLGQMRDYGAVELFINLASAAQPGFTLTPRNVTAIATICRRLDGIPLAIEMAAAQIASMSSQEIAAGLDGHFALRLTGWRTALPRHQTLRATLDWSYGLLAEGERVLLARLSVFAGGWTMDMARQVCMDALPSQEGEGARQLGIDDITFLLTQLVRKSLVVMTRGEEYTRYTMLETIREYALEALTQRGELAATRRQHA